MSLATTTSKIIYTGTDAVSVYAYDFKIFEDTDLVVTEVLIADETETVLTITTDYTVSGAGDASGGNVTLVAGNLPSTKKLVIQRVLPLTQAFDLVENDNAPAASFEDTYDKGIAISQQIQEQIDRSILQPITATAAIVFPSPDALKGIRWNTAGDGLENVTLLDATSIDAAEASAAAASASEVAAAASEVNAAASEVAAAASAATIDLSGPNPIGSVTPNTGKFTTLEATTSIKTAAGATVTEFSTDGTLAGNSDVAIPTEKAVKTYVANSSPVPSATCSFQAKPTPTQDNIAVGSDVTILLGTEVFDTGGDFAANTFTAPQTGRYSLNLILRLNSVDNACTYYRVSIVTSNRSYLFTIDSTKILSADTWYTVSLPVIADMDANDTAHIIVKQADGAQQTDIEPTETIFSGSLI